MLFTNFVVFQCCLSLVGVWGWFFVLDCCWVAVATGNVGAAAAMPIRPVPAVSIAAPATHFHPSSSASSARPITPVVMMLEVVLMAVESREGRAAATEGGSLVE